MSDSQSYPRNLSGIIFINKILFKSDLWISTTETMEKIVKIEQPDLENGRCEWSIPLFKWIVTGNYITRVCLSRMEVE